MGTESALRLHPGSMSRRDTCGTLFLQSGLDRSSLWGTVQPNRYLPCSSGQVGMASDGPLALATVDTPSLQDTTEASPSLHEGTRSPVDTCSMLQLRCH